MNRRQAWRSPGSARSVEEGPVDIKSGCECGAAQVSAPRTGNIYDSLRRAIISGDRPPGSALVETELAQSYGVSRTPIREALLKLRQDGLVTNAGRGLSVRTQSPEEILEVYEVRKLLEAAATSLAAVRRTELDLARIRHAYDDMSVVDATSSETLRAANDAFHNGIWTASHNWMLLNLLEYVDSHIPHYIESTLTHPGRWDVVLKEYLDIVNAIEEQREDDAENLAISHIDGAMEIRLSLLAVQKP